MHSTLNYSIIHQSKHNTAWLICFYGFGQSEQVFTPLIELVEDKYSILVIHLPYAEKDFCWTKKILSDEIYTLLDILEIEKFIGISYSVGSRMNLCLAESMPERIQQIIIAAPDGIKLGFWNQLATTSNLGIKIFHRLVQHPHALPSLISILFKCKLLPKKLYTFAIWHVRDYTSRMRVYHVWMNMKQLIPNLQLIEKNCVEYQFPIHAFFGKADAVIDKNAVKKLAANVPSAKIVILNKGHNLLDKDLFAHLAPYLN